MSAIQQSKIFLYGTDGLIDYDPLCTPENPRPDPSVNWSSRLVDLLTDIAFRPRRMRAS